jgi:nucleotide-binding universal stress UspA family protein
MDANRTETHDKKNYLISIDGSDHSDWGFDMTFNEIYKKNDYLTVLHVANHHKISDIPFKYQPDQIISKYETKLIGKLPKHDYILLRKDRINEKTHALEVVNEVARTNNADLLVLGCQGHKGVKDRKELSSGITFLIKHINIPSIIVKENSQRAKKEVKGFNWLVCIENHYTRSYKAFELATTLIDKEKDYITALHLHTSGDNYKETEDAFEKYCVKVGIAKRKFVAIEKNSKLSVGKNICEYVNLGDDYIDFVVIGHNISKYSMDMNASPTVDIIRFAQANILFSSKA